MCKCMQCLLQATREMNALAALVTYIFMALRMQSVCMMKKSEHIKGNNNANNNRKMWNRSQFIIQSSYFQWSTCVHNVRGAWALHIVYVVVNLNCQKLSNVTFEWLLREKKNDNVFDIFHCYYCCCCRCHSWTLNLQLTVSQLMNKLVIK